MTTPRLGAPELVSAQATPETTVNEQVRWLEQAANVFWVKDKDTLTPPGSPADGDAYIINGTGAGGWTGKDLKIAFRMSTGWLYITPWEGLVAYVQDETCFYMFHNTWFSWNADNAAIWLADTKRRFLSPFNLYAAADPQTLTSSASITPNGENGINFKVTLAHNTTLENPTNFNTAQAGFIEITQDGTGSRTMAYGTNWKFAGGTDPVLSTAPGTKDMLFYQVMADGTSIYGNLVKAISS